MTLTVSKYFVVGEPTLVDHFERIYFEGWSIPARASIGNFDVISIMSEWGMTLERSLHVKKIAEYWAGKSLAKHYTKMPLFQFHIVDKKGKLIEW